MAKNESKPRVEQLVRMLSTPGTTDDPGVVYFQYAINLVKNGKRLPRTTSRLYSLIGDNLQVNSAVVKQAMCDFIQEDIQPYYAEWKKRCNGVPFFDKNGNPLIGNIIQGLANCT